jgi:hypothetical protein
LHCCPSSWREGKLPADSLCAGSGCT